MLQLTGIDAADTSGFFGRSLLQSVTLSVTRANGVSVYSGSVKTNARMQITFIPTQAALKLQRRRDFRLPLVRSVALACLSCNPRKSIRAEVIDLSGGGAQVVVGEPLAVGERVQFPAPMGSLGDEETVEALVLSCEPQAAVAPERNERYRVRLTFDDDTGRVSLSEEQRDEIVRYLFARQREMLKLRVFLAPLEGKQKQRTRRFGALLSRVRGVL